MPGRRWWVLRKRMLRARQQVLQAQRAKECMVPRQQGHRVQSGIGRLHEPQWRRVPVRPWRPMLWRHLREQERCLLRECPGEQLRMPGEWWRLLWKCMRCTRQQVLQVPLGAESPVVPSHRGHQVRIHLVVPLRSSQSRWIGQANFSTLLLQNDLRLHLPDLKMP